MPTTAGALSSSGRLTGLLASALLLIQVFLMARVPFVERAWGQDQLARAHRYVGITSFFLMVAHIVLIVLGYAATYSAIVWGILVDFTVNYAGGLIAVAGTLALIMVVITSARVARRRMRYESWHLLHLYAYVGVGLALPHQLWTGQDFVGSRLASAFWWTLYAVCAGAVLVFRVLLPLWKSARVGARVVDVRQEQPGMTTVTVAGRGVRRLKASGGQFFQWRFLGSKGWTRANPYSLSAAPTGHTLRLTARHVGDGSSRLGTLKLGSRALLEGPYGRMHAGTRTQQKVLLLGAGIGITPMRAMLESLPQQPGDVTIVNRASTPHALVLDAEIAQLAADRGARYERLVGPRVSGHDSWLPAHLALLNDAQALRELCPDIATRDVYVCGAGPGWRPSRRPRSMWAFLARTCTSNASTTSSDRKAAHMRRIILWLATTATILTLLLIYRTSLSTGAAATTVAAAPTTDTGQSSPTGTDTGAGTTGAASAAGSTASASATYTGNAVSTKYGPVQVQIVVVGGKITQASAIEYPTSNGKDKQINSRAIPILNAAAVSKQSAKIDTVSGATYTSDGYLTSLQSAIDRAHL